YLTAMRANSANQSPGDHMNPENPKAYRLPTHALPRRYDIAIDARLGREDVHGKVRIELDIREPRDVIELHARDMQLSNARLTTDPNHTVIANGPLVSTTTSEDGKSKTWTFAPTKPMSSYLVALIIGDVAATEKEDVNGTPISVWAMRGKEHMGSFAHRYTK